MEQDKPKNLLILGYTLAIVSVLIGTVIFVDQYLKADVRQEYEKKVLQAEDVDFRDLRAAEDAKLGTDKSPGRYVYIDQAKGLVRLPKARARELVLKEWAARPDGVVQPEPAPGAVPAPGAAPAPAAAPTDGTAPTPGSPPGALAPAPTPTTAKEPPSTAQPAPLKPGETPKKGPKGDKKADEAKDKGK